MLSKILPVILLIIGSAAGVGAGIFMRPDVTQTQESAEDLTIEEGETAESQKAPADDTSVEMDYVKLSNQFVVPIVKDREVVALVVLSLSLEVPEGNSEAVFRKEPKLRDSFLQVLFDHANIGGFDGAFTEASNLAVLRTGLREAGQKHMSADVVKDVLILEIARQDY